MTNYSKKDYDWTINRPYYNKLRKRQLEHVGDIRCSFCGYHRGENSKFKYYSINADGEGKHPSWKLVTKNRKQWMEKPYHLEEDFDLEWSSWEGNTIPIKRDVKEQFHLIYD